jgi:hypothetical protein
MNPIRDELLQELDKIDRPGAICVGDSVPPVLPGLTIEGVGPVGLPLTEVQAQTLIQYYRQASYGKGAETVVDTNVRRVWELEPKEFALANSAWPPFLDETVKTVQDGLGLADALLECHLYKLLLYEKGSFFVPHRDSEKLPRMVASLVITLPSEYEGGELVVRHEDQEETFDFGGPESQFLTHFAAFYADCEHENKPLRSGYRLCLVYNIVLAFPDAVITAPLYKAGVDGVARVLEKWRAEGNSERLLITLDHQYTQESLYFSTLKGLDRVRAQTLVDAAARVECKAHLALLTYYEMGEAECDYDYGGYRSRHYRYDDEEEDEEIDGEVEMGEVYESSLTVDHWRDTNGEECPYGPFDIDDDEVVCGEKSLTEVDPKQEFEGYTGNAGMELTRWYHHAAIVIWPEASHFQIICEAGVDRSVPSLRLMVEEWYATGRTNSSLKTQCLEFARQIIDSWPQETYAGRGYPIHHDRQILPLLRTLDDHSLIESFLTKVVLQDASVTLTDGIADICQSHGWKTFTDPLLRIVAESNNEETHRFRMRKDLRAHLHQKIDQHRCDLTHVTERKGSPYTLVCTKTQDTYQRLLDEYERDLRLLTEITEIQKQLCRSDITQT